MSLLRGRRKKMRMSEGGGEGRVENVLNCFVPYAALRAGECLRRRRLKSE